MSDFATLAKYQKFIPGFTVRKPVDTSADYDPFAHVPYMPQEGKQKEFFECQADIIIYGGAVAAGKSLCLLAKALEGTKIPGFVGTIFRRTATEIQAKGGIWDKARAYYHEIPKAIARDSTQFLDWRFLTTGSSINFAHSDNLFVNKLGAEMAFIGVDELANDWSEEEFLFLMSRNRSNCGYKPQFVATCNPNCDSFLIKNSATGAWKVGSWLEWWIDDDGYPIPDRSGKIRYFFRTDRGLIWGNTKQDIIDQHPDILDIVPMDEGVTVDDLIKSFTFISANVYDNPAFLRENPSYLASLLMLDEVNQKRFLWGNWKVSDDVGIVFNPNDFQFIDRDAVPEFGIDVRAWDFAAKEELNADANACFTASQKWRFVPGKGDAVDIYILDVFWEQTLDADSCTQLAEKDGRKVAVAWELEGGSAALKFAAILEKELKKLVRGVQTYPLRPNTDKVGRAKPWARAAKLGNVYVVKDAFWNNELRNSLIKFTGKRIPKVTDIIDAGSICYQWYIDTYRKPSKPLAGTPRYKKIK